MDVEHHDDQLWWYYTDTNADTGSKSDAGRKSDADASRIADADAGSNADADTDADAGWCYHFQRTGDFHQCEHCGNNCCPQRYGSAANVGRLYYEEIGVR